MPYRYISGGENGKTFSHKTRKYRPRFSRTTFVLNAIESRIYAGPSTIT